MNILVVSHERSGTHLTLNSFNENNCINVPVGDKKEINNFLRTYNSNRILKSHHQSFWFDDFVYEKYKVVYVKRNFLDVLNSMYFYFKKHKHVFPQHETIDDFIFSSPQNEKFDNEYSMVKSNNYIERWYNHVKSFTDKKVINVCFEEIVSDYDSFKKRMLKYDIKCVDDKPKIGIGQSVSPRKGIIGDYTNNIDNKTLNKINDYIFSGKIKFDTSLFSHKNDYFKSNSIKNNAN